MARIAFGGFQHETNTFSTALAAYEDFERAGGWPGLSRGKEIFAAVEGTNLPVAGFIAAATRAKYDLLPLLWCSASPSGRVTRDAYERIAGELCRRLSEALPLDGLFLDLHGAMVAEHLADGEGELLARVRRIVGPDLPIVCSLDFHANITKAMVDRSTAMTAYRSYPHVDMAETGERSAALLDRVIGRGPLAKALRKLPFLIPLPWQCTLIDPAAALFRTLEGLQDAGIADMSFAPGFSPADIPDCGPAVLAYGDDRATVEAKAERLAASVAEAEGDFAGKVWNPDEAVREAKRLAERAAGPVVLADGQDNPGAGGHSDTVGLIEALIHGRAEGAVAGLLCDPVAAEIAHRAGEGAELEFAIGEGSRMPGHRPLAARFKVERLGDGRFNATGPFYAGNRMQLGPMVLLSTGGVRIVLSSRKQQAADQAMFRHLGVEPREQKILALKSSVHFRADFGPIAAAVLVVAAPGANPIDHRKLPYRHLKPGMRLMPKGPAFMG